MISIICKNYHGETYEINCFQLFLFWLDCSPLKLHEIKRSSRVSYGKRKLKAVSDRISESVAKVLDIQRTNLDHCPDRCMSCDDVNDLVSYLKDKILCSTRNEKLNLLTLVPQSWSIDKTVQEFGVTHLLKKPES